jgi:hypothetical protein
LLKTRQRQRLLLKPLLFQLPLLLLPLLLEELLLLSALPEAKVDGRWWRHWPSCGAPQVPVICRG